ncbi:MAG: hypothetical protein P9M03_06890 [Candidatus Theseobacter exili]|nr:hypothetical protein [Candidatus Theseobacter exili]
MAAMDVVLLPSMGYFVTNKDVLTDGEIYRKNVRNAELNFIQIVGTRECVQFAWKTLSIERIVIWTFTFLE